jgi:ubiquinone/menaquinone biosynthesis C-methylase UbiE
MSENFLTPEAIIGQLNLDKSMVVADFGCGSGGWTLPLARLISEGRIFGLDIVKGPLSALDSSAKLEGLMNVQTKVCDLEKDSGLPANSCDAILMTNLLFQCEDKKAVIAEAKRVLKSGGKILDVDWKKSVSFGPRERAVLPEDAKALFQDAGFTLEKEFEAGPYHYGMVVVK